MSNNDQLIKLLTTSSNAALKEILSEAIEFERFVKVDARNRKVSDLKDILNRIKRDKGLVHSTYNHLELDDTESERSVVMSELYNFVITNVIKEDKFDIDISDFDSNSVYTMIEHRTQHIDNNILMRELYKQQSEFDIELYECNDESPLEARTMLIKKLSSYLSAKDVQDIFPNAGDLKKRIQYNEGHIKANAKEVTNDDLLYYLMRKVSKDQLRKIDGNLDFNRDQIINLIARNYTIKDVKTIFHAYVSDDKKAEEIEQDKKERISRDVSEQKMIDESLDPELEEMLDSLSESSGEEKFTFKQRKIVKNDHKKAMANMADTYRFKYVNEEITHDQLPKNTKVNITESIKKVFGNLKAHELTSLDTLEKAREQLCLKYPYARMIIDGILNDVKRGFLVGRREIQIRPILLVGEPGNGKSSLARDLMRALDVVVSTVNAGGMTETHILGVSNGYSSAMPSIITTAISSSKTINPCIIVDEIDKSSKDSRNGDITAGLLSLLEPAEAVSWYEKFLNLNVDASKVNWILTANDIDRVPLPLVSRCTVYRVESPDAEHVGALVQSIVADYASEVGVDPRFFSLSTNDVDYLRETMPKHRSVRILRELVRMLLDEQESSVYHA